MCALALINLIRGKQRSKLTTPETNIYHISSTSSSSFWPVGIFIYYAACSLMVIDKCFTEIYKFFPVAASNGPLTLYRKDFLSKIMIKRYTNLVSLYLVQITYVQADKFDTFPSSHFFALLIQLLCFS